MKIGTFLFILIPLLALAQDVQQERAEQEKRLKALRTEINAVEKKISDTGTKKEKLADLVADLEQKLALRKKLLRELENDKALTERELNISQDKIFNLHSEINRYEANIDTLWTEIASLKSMVAKRALYAYKHWDWDELQMIISAKDFNQALVRKKYFNLIAQRDKHNLELLKEKKRKLNRVLLQKFSTEATLLSEDRELKDRLQYKNELIEERKNEEQKIERDRRQKSKLLEKLKKDHKALLRELEIKKSAAQQIENMIAVLEEKAREAAAIPISKIFPEVDFISLRGKMEWPTQGKITSHFGRVLNQELKTWTENTGIDIEATNGAPVKAVASGKVTVVTWLRGYGNTMIISHPNDFYTVYTHLDEVLVNPGSNVKGGTVIATVGDAGARGKPKLHFEIWEKKEKQNPEKWLKKRG